MNAGRGRAILVWSLLVLVSGVAAADAGEGAKLAPGRHQVGVEGVQFTYFVAGNGPLLVVQSPGWGVGSEYLRNEFEPLQRNFTLLFYDTRGSGSSSRPQEPSTIRIAQFAEDLERLRQYWGLKQMRLLGHSWGGGIALAYAVRYPQYLSALVLVDSSIPGFDYSQIRAVTHAQWVAARSDVRLEDAMRSMEADAPVHTDQEFSDKLHRELPFYFFDPVVGPQRFWQTYNGPPSAWAWNAWIANFDAERHALQDIRIDGIHVPTLIIYGREDRICPAVMGERLHERIGTSTLRILEDAGHLPWIEVPGKFFAEVNTFLRTATAGTRPAASSSVR